jgi:hypothetical protein
VCMCVCVCMSMSVCVCVCDCACTCHLVSITMESMLWSSRVLTQTSAKRATMVRVCVYVCV